MCVVVVVVVGGGGLWRWLWRVVKRGERERDGEERRASGATRWVEGRGIGRSKVYTGLRERATKAEHGESGKDGEEATTGWRRRGKGAVGGSAGGR